MKGHILIVHCPNCFTTLAGVGIIINSIIKVMNPWNFQLTLLPCIIEWRHTMMINYEQRMELICCFNPKAFTTMASVILAGSISLLLRLQYSYRQSKNCVHDINRESELHNNNSSKAKQTIQNSYIVPTFADALKALASVAAFCASEGWAILESILPFVCDWYY